MNDAEFSWIFDALADIRSCVTDLGMHKTSEGLLDLEFLALVELAQPQTGLKTPHSDVNSYDTSSKNPKENVINLREYRKSRCNLKDSQNFDGIDP